MQTDAEFRAAFEAGTLTPESFRHRDHLRMAWIFLNAEPLPVVLEKFPKALRCFADTIGASGLYHETITWAYLILIHAHMRQTEGAKDWANFLRLNPELEEKNLLERYYRPETLRSSLARQVFLLPDAAIRLEKQRQST